MSNPRSPSIELVETPTPSSRITPGKHTIIASLGKGGMANVYLAAMSGPARFSKLLVLKVLRDDVEVSRDELVAMFLDEARLAARLQHRNIVQTYEFGEAGGHSFRRARDLHHLEVRAEGYQTVKQLVTFELDREFRIVLRPLPAPTKERVRRPASAAGDVVPPAPPAAPAATQPVSTRGEEAEPGVELKTRPGRPDFDFDDPYAN